MNARFIFYPPFTWYLFLTRSHIFFYNNQVNLNGINKLWAQDAHKVEVYLLSKSNHIASPVAIPTLSFDGITRDIFMTMQKEDESLKPLWEYAHNNQKHFFIMDSILMCLTHFNSKFHIPCLSRASTTKKESFSSRPWRPWSWWNQLHKNVTQ